MKTSRSLWLASMLLVTAGRADETDKGGKPRAPGVCNHPGVLTLSEVILSDGLSHPIGQSGAILVKMKRPQLNESSPGRCGPVTGEITVSSSVAGVAPIKAQVVTTRPDAEQKVELPAEMFAAGASIAVLVKDTHVGGSSTTTLRPVAQTYAISR